MSPKVQLSVDKDQEIADALNHVVGSASRKTPRPSPQTRDRDASSPRKHQHAFTTRSQTVIVTESGSPPRRVSSQLKQRTVRAPEHRIDRSNPYEIPADVDDDPDSLFVPETKTRLLKRKRADKESPLKGHGVLDPTNVESVRLASSDSPVRRRVGRPPKSGGSSNPDQNGHKPVGRPKAARHASRISLTDGQEAQLHDARETKLRATDRRRSRRQAGLLAEGFISTPPLNSLSPQRGATPAEEDPAEIGSTIEVSQEMEGVESEVDAGEGIAPSQQRPSEAHAKDQSSVSRTLEAARTRAADEGGNPDAAAEQQRALANERQHQDERQRAIDGVEDAIRLHNLSRPWTDILYAKDKLRKTDKPLTRKGRRASKTIKELLQLYEEMYQNNPRIAFPTVQSRQALQEVRRRCDLLKPVYGPGDNSQTVRVLYQNIIPALALSLQLCLRVGYVDGELTIDAYKELIELLKLTDEVVDRACEWVPRPTMLDKGSLSMMQNEVRYNVKTLLEKYELIVDKHEDRIEEVKYLAEFKKTQEQSALELQQQKDKVRAEKKKRSEEYYKAAIQYNRVRQAASQRERANVVEKEHQISASPLVPWQANALVDLKKRPYTQQTRNLEPVIDVEEYDIDDLEPNAATGHSAQRSTTRSQEVRPRIRREATEDIPPPITPIWNKAQNAVLIRELQRFFGTNRYFHIFNSARTQGHPLRNFSMEDIGKQAMFLKKTILGAEDFGDRPNIYWDFLLSVE